MRNNNNPIGVFDSGIGGLTVVKEIIRELPNENIIYIGDTARVPYGTRGKPVILSFALQLVHFLLKKNVKALVVACNTISSTCLKEIKRLSPVPVLGVVEPAANQAIKITKGGCVGVIGTRATISSKMYQKLLGKKIKTVTSTCPLFVPMAEEGLTEGPAAKLIAEKYLKIFHNLPVDCLILGCTHYPLLKKIIQDNVGKKIVLIDSAKPTVEELKNILKKNKLVASQKKAKYTFYVTDNTNRTQEIADRFFEKKLPVKLLKASLA